jgi:polysaccharide export outer membrane protein
MAVTVRGVTDWRAVKCGFVMLFWLLLVFFGAAPRSCAQQKLETPQQTNDRIRQLAQVAGAHPVDTAVGTGDLLHVDVFDVPELSREVRVSDTGDISYPLIPGRIKVAGLTPFQVEDALEKLLVENGLVSHPQVSVFVKEQNSQPVSVVGAVNHPMVYQVIRPTTLLEVLTAAGGITDDAGSDVMITRKSAVVVDSSGAPASATPNSSPSDTASSTSSDTQTITIRLQDLLESGDPSFNINVLGGDVVSVPHAGIVYVMGAGVAQQGGYVMQGHGEGITVLKAIAMAHGLTGFAKADSAVIMRANPATGKRDEIPVKIKQIENHKMDDVALNSNDILYVPDSFGKKALARGAEAAVGVGTQVAVFRSAY